MTMSIAGAGTARSACSDFAGAHDADMQTVVRASVRGVLDRSPAFRALGETTQHQLAADMVTVASRLILSADMGGQFAAAVQAVDFPEFVAGLVNGVFDAAVHTSIDQMEAYADLVRHVALSVSDFPADNASAQHVRDALTRGCARLFP